MKRIGMLTSGGDCQALNAAMRGVVKGLNANLDELEIYGFYDGYKGLIYGNYRLLTSKDFSGILTKGGTILGTSRQPFKYMRVPDENGLDKVAALSKPKVISVPDENGLDKVAAMKHTYHKLNLDCLVILGGNGTQKTANLLREEAAVVWMQLLHSNHPSVLFAFVVIVIWLPLLNAASIDAFNAFRISSALFVPP